MKPETSSEAPLGEGQAVQEVRQYIEKKEENAEARESHVDSSAAGPAIVVPIQRSPEPVEAHPDTETPEEKKSRRKKPFRHALERSFWGFRASGFFPASDLRNQVGRGWGLGAFARTNLLTFLEPQFNWDWYYASDQPG